LLYLLQFEKRMELAPESQRLRIVFGEFKEAGLGKNSTDFATVLDTTQSNISRMMNGEYPLSYTVVKNVCHKLGYSPNWFINGEGNKKNKKEGVELINEIQMFRTEIDILTNRIKRLEAEVGINKKDKKQ
jgi:transcriptional regulator with XRE-family HTH domain